MSAKPRSKRNWTRVSFRNKCPICGHSSWCTYTESSVRCMRVKSDVPCENGGWFHLQDNIPLPVQLADRIPRSKKDAEKIARDCFYADGAKMLRWRLADSLGVSRRSLELLGVGLGKDHNGEEWASFPSRGIDGEVVGITRRYEDGSKKTLAGTSNSGVFCRKYWWDATETVYIVEGASDVAAMIDANMSVLGRPSNIGGIQVLTKYLQRHRPKRIIVLGENDFKPDRRGQIESCPPDCKGCAYCFPGMYGMVSVAVRLSGTLGVNVETMLPPEGIKDARQWWHLDKMNGLRASEA